MVIRNDPPRDDPTRPLVGSARQTATKGRQGLQGYVNPLAVTDGDPDVVAPPTTIIQVASCPSEMDQRFREPTSHPPYCMFVHAYYILNFNILLPKFHNPAN